MSIEVKDKGRYEIFETSHRNRILVLNETRFYAWGSARMGETLTLTDSHHKKERRLETGEFIFANFQGVQGYRNHPHLFFRMDGRVKFDEMILPNGLPAIIDEKRTVIRTSNKVDPDKMEEIRSVA